MLEPIVFSVSMASSTTLSPALNLNAGFKKVYIEMPSFASGGTHYIRASSDGSTFRQVFQDNTSSGAAAIFQIAQTASNCILPIPAGFQYYKVENTTATTDATTVYKLICF